MYENPSIREMFKSLDLIESFGSGVGKAKRAMSENGSDDIQYQEYDENVDITSVVIPISKKISSIFLQSHGSCHERPESSFERPKFRF